MDIDYAAQTALDAVFDDDDNPGLYIVEVSFMVEVHADSPGEARRLVNDNIALGAYQDDLMMGGQAIYAEER